MAQSYGMNERTTEVEYHVTAKRNGSLYGHSTECCDESGCAGGEMFLCAAVASPDTNVGDVLMFDATDVMEDERS